MNRHLIIDFDLSRGNRLDASGDPLVEVAAVLRALADTITRGGWPGGTSGVLWDTHGWTVGGWGITAGPSSDNSAAAVAARQAAL